MQKLNQMEPWFDDKEADAVYRYMKSGGWCGDFKMTRLLEQEVCNYTGAKHCCIVNNGTTALTIALMACGCKRNSVVVVPAYTMVASAYSASILGAKIVLADINPDTLNMTTASIEKALNRVKADFIMPVHINGRACPLPVYPITVIEDACQAMGSRYNGRHLGTNGKIGVLSFNSFKIISTGQGGILLTDDDDIFLKCKKIKDFGRSGGRGSKYEILGLNAKYTDLQAVIGIEQMKKLDDRVQRKKHMYKLYAELLKPVIHCIYPFKTDSECSPWYMDFLCNKRDQLIAFLSDREIETQPFYEPIHRLPYYENQFKGQQFSQAEYVSKHGIWLPSSSFLEDEQIAFVCDAIKEFYL